MRLRVTYGNDAIVPSPGTPGEGERDLVKTWRSAVIGTNVVGVTHLRAISTAPMCTLAAVCDLAPARAQAALHKLDLRDVPVYESLPEMLRKEKLDVVHVCTPSGAHLDCAMDAIDAGVNVICEKPLEVTLA